MGLIVLQKLNESEKMKIGFTLLHYNNIEVTKAAVQYLENLKHDDEVHIIIIDNFSPNKSGDELKQLFSDKNNIHVVLNTENSGFAKGNNIAYAYAKKIGCEIIVVMNSDVFIKEHNFCAGLENIVRREKTEIIAPRITGVSGNQNPFRARRLSTRKALQMLVYNCLMSVLYEVPGINEIIVRKLDGRKKVEKKDVEKDEEQIWAPHGSCIIYTNEWIENEDVAFVPGTFMYFEEDILAEYVAKKHYRIVYKKEIEVFHMEDASVNASSNNSLQKRKFICKNMVQSISLFLKYRFKKCA